MKSRLKIQIGALLCSTVLLAGCSDSAGGTVISEGSASQGVSSSEVAPVKAASGFGFARAEKPLGQLPVIIRSADGKILEQTTSDSSGYFRILSGVQPPFEIEVLQGDESHSGFFEAGHQGLYNVNTLTTISNRARKKYQISDSQADLFVRTTLGLSPSSDLNFAHHLNRSEFSHKQFRQKATTAGGFNAFVDSMVARYTAPKQETLAGVNVTPLRASLSVGAEFGDGFSVSKISTGVGSFLGGHIADKLADVAIGWVMGQLGFVDPVQAALAEILNELSLIRSQLNVIQSQVQATFQEVRNAQIGSILDSLNQLFSDLDGLQTRYLTLASEPPGNTVSNQELDALSASIAGLGNPIGRLHNAQMGIVGSPGLIDLMVAKHMPRLVTSEKEDIILQEIAYVQGYQTLACNLLCEASHLAAPMTVRELEQTMDQLVVSVKLQLQKLPTRADRFHFKAATDESDPFRTASPMISHEIVYDQATKQSWSRNCPLVFVDDVLNSAAGIAVSFLSMGTFADDENLGIYVIPTVAQLQTLGQVGDFNELQNQGFTFASGKTIFNTPTTPHLCWARFPGLTDFQALLSYRTKIKVGNDYLVLYDLDKKQAVGMDALNLQGQLLMVRQDFYLSAFDIQVRAIPDFTQPGLYHCTASSPSFKDYSRRVIWSLAINGATLAANNSQAYISNQPGSEGLLQIRNLPASAALTVTAQIGTVKRTIPINGAFNTDTRVKNVLVSPVRRVVSNYPADINLNAQAMTRSGQALDVTSQVTWSSDSGLVTISRGGRATITAPAGATNVTIQAQYGGQTGTAKLILQQP